MRIKYEYGDVTKKMPEYVSAHCISEDCVMGSGVVIAYRKLIPELKDKCIEHVKWANEQDKLHPGNTHLYKHLHGSIRTYRHESNGLVVYNMFTKKKVNMHAGVGMTEKEYLQNLRESLETVRDYMLFYNEQKLAISKIGCGRDRCSWEHVLRVLELVFSDTDIEILVCEYDEKKELTH